MHRYYDIWEDEEAGIWVCDNCCREGGDECIEASQSDFLGITFDEGKAVEFKLVLTEEKSNELKG